MASAPACTEDAAAVEGLRVGGGGGGAKVGPAVVEGLRAGGDGGGSKVVAAAVGLRVGGGGGGSKVGVGEDLEGPAIVADPVMKATGLGVANPVAEIPAAQKVRKNICLKRTPTYQQYIVKFQRHRWES